MSVPVTSPSAAAIRIPELDGVEPVDAAEAFRDLPGLALFDGWRVGGGGRWSLLAADPIEVIETATDGPEPLAPARRLLARMAPDRTGLPFSGGLFGYIGYDFGRRIERRLRPIEPGALLPELRLALHDWMLAWDRGNGRAWLCGRAVDGDTKRLAARLADVRERVARAAAATTAQKAAPSAPSVEPPLLAFDSETSRPHWIRDVEFVRGEIARGELYQVNLARRLSTPFAADPWPLFRALHAGEPASHSAYIDAGPAAGARRAILSASPEAFLSVTPGGLVATKPIKGTRPRGATPAEDRALARELLASEKDRAENTMIVDVLRNDLGRVCRPGTIRVPRLWRLERTRTVQHLVSTVTGRLAPGRDAFDLLTAAFPGGSVTGAPKIRAMELIDELEPVARGPYTGAALWIGADGAMESSILIRTFVADGARLSLHVGGGITWRSDPEAEWDETVAKSAGPLRAIAGGS